MNSRAMVGAARRQAEVLISGAVPPLMRRLRGLAPHSPARYLLVLAHARSGSTLAMHLLDHNEAIGAVGEHHTGYRTAADLDRLQSRTRMLSRAVTAQREWFADKLVYNHYELGDEILDSPDVHFLFMIRRPEAALPSIGRINPALPTPEDQLRYYRLRIENMIEVAERVGDRRRMAFLSYEQLLDSPGEALTMLSEFLGLDQPLSSEYGTGRLTGRRAWGDPSDTIRSGRIEKRSDQPVAPLPDTVQAQANQVYDSALIALSRVSVSLPTHNPEADSA